MNRDLKYRMHAPSMQAAIVAQQHYISETVKSKDSTHIQPPKGRHMRLAEMPVLGLNNGPNIGQRLEMRGDQSPRGLYS